MVDEIATKIIDCFKKGNKILICGNGGSAAQATHFVGECLGKFEKEGKPLPAVSLFDLSTITSIANDYSFCDIFSRQVEALGVKGDILITLSTSGRSKNIIKAKNAALEKGMTVIQFPTNSSLGTPTYKTQETHLEMIHKIMKLVEKDCR